MTDKEAVNLGALRLAFVGDAVHTLYAREKTVSSCGSKVPVLNSLVTEKVNASAQSKAFDRLKDALSGNELDILMRGRNAHVGHVPKNQSVEDYHKATAFESLLGYLYLTGNTARIEEILKITEEENR